jgi:hypothetical protein
MKPYGLKRNFNEVEDFGKNGRASTKCHRSSVRLLHRKERRIQKQGLKLLLYKEE